MLRKNVQDPISAILALNTVANTVGATAAGAIVGNTYGPTWVGVYSMIFTLIILLFSEIIPKNLGVNYANQLAPKLSLPLHWFVIGFRYTGLLWLCRLMTQKFQTESEGPHEDEILALTRLGAKAGTLHETEATWAMNALKLNDKIAANLMTPRTVVYMLPAELTLEETKERTHEWHFSRIPIFENHNQDKIIGLANIREIYDKLTHGSAEELKNTTLRDLAHKAEFVPETIKCNALLTRFLESHQHMVIVINEYGGVVGVISLEDVLEFILGEEIVDQYDKHPDMQILARELGDELLKDINSDSNSKE